MKNKLILDMSVYILAPVVLCNLISNNKINYIILGLVSFILFYSFLTIKKEFRLNTSAIIFSFLYMGMYLLKQGVESDFVKYIYDTYFFIIASISIIGLRFINKDIIKQIYIDILRSKGHTKSYICNVLKNKSLIQLFEKTSLLVDMNLLSIAFVKVYSIATYGPENYKSTLDLEMLVYILFIAFEVYMIYIIIQEYKKREKKMFKYKEKGKIKININKKDNNEKIIYLNKYKRTNK